MTPLEAAKILAAHEIIAYDDFSQPYCIVCDMIDTHTPDCPILALPQIVAALEAVEALVQEDAHTNDYAVSYQGQMACNSCDAITSSNQWTDKEGRAFPQPHTPACRWQRVVTALKGDA